MRCKHYLEEDVADGWSASRQSAAVGDNQAAAAPLLPSPAIY